MLAAPASNTQHWRPERPRMWAVPELTPQPHRTDSDPALVALSTRAAADADPASTGEPTLLSMGMQLPGSRLRLLERISDGGCGVVYRGEHVDLQRPVAIKVMRVEALGAGARELFLDEARTTTRIESRYVVQVVDFGELPDGRVWYAMEHLGGRSLDQLIATGRIEPARAIALLRMACKGLAASHEAGVVHRDVKPQNLVVIARGGREHLVLVDFGIALPCGTKPAVVSGTPEYMAREQILRDVLDERTDIYGLGCCAYELLTGLPVVDRSSTIQHALLMHTEGVDPPFPAELGIPAQLQEIVRRCLAVDREDRFANMHELEAALCEAQIDAHLPLLRDDLELPLVDAARRSRIADGFTALTRPRRRLRDRAALLSSSVIAAALALVAIWPGHPAAADDVPAQASS
ncbi:MAG: serine/threonine protein kinase, partial [Deltaproteobacteria bacterium]|nr:serine/threonine protein kinase [Nannocystaceae bacterium]